MLYMTSTTGLRIFPTDTPNVVDIIRHGEFVGQVVTLGHRRHVARYGATVVAVRDTRVGATMALCRAAAAR